ncbi:DUF4245 domain-containing protein [Yinghuangia soli]|uniref:DUF4245 domain-containing protein n=1 Tax=Yinghuangia soli TaxID=2908204 RepID=A0AA41PZE8_9ACTN|nr:DUF4245 domain-containing protein [Yinghuangia soli]MCF2528155.1 DUF4245 domain-containing protein [Yinghuangia soli]
MAKKRGLETVRDMVLSLGVVGIAVVLLLIFGQHSAQDPVKRIDYSLKFQQASQDAPYPLLGPAGLPDQWRATSAYYDGMKPADTTWHIGFINPNDEYAAVEQSNGDPVQFVKAKSKGGAQVGTVDVAGKPWASYDGPKYRSLVRTEDGVTTIVTGTATFDDLAVLAAALRTAPPLAGWVTAPSTSPSAVPGGTPGSTPAAP